MYNAIWRSTKYVFFFLILASLGFGIITHSGDVYTTNNINSSGIFVNITGDIMTGNLGIKTAPVYEIDANDTIRALNNILIGDTTGSASFRGEGDLYAVGGIKAMEGLFAEAQAYGAGLEVLDNSLAVTYTNVLSGNATLNSTTKVIYDTQASFDSTYKGQFFRVISSTPSFTGSTGEIISVIDSTHLALSFATAGTDTIVDATGMSFVIYPRPIFFAGDNGVVSVNIGENEDANLGIHIDNGTGFHGVYIDDTAGADQHQAFTIDQDFDNRDGVVAQNIYSYSSTGGEDLHYDMMTLEMDVSGINNSHFNFIDMNVIGSGTNNHIDGIRVSGDINHIIHQGSEDTIKSAYYNGVNVTHNFTTNGDNSEIFSADNDWIYIGSDVNFTHISVDLDSGADVNLRFDFYYCNSSGGWSEFLVEPLDTTNDFITSGTISFDNPTDRGVCNKEYDGTPFSDTTSYTYIGLMRKRNIVSEPPVENLFTISGSDTVFKLQKDMIQLSNVGGNSCEIRVDADNTCDAGTAMVVDNGIAICAVCS